MPKVIQQIKFNRRLNRTALLSGFALILLALACFYPLGKGEQATEAVTGTVQGSSLSLNLANATASVDLTVTSPDGTFAASDTDAAFSVMTDNYSGYTLSILGGDGTLSDGEGNNLTSISSAISEEVFSAASGAAFNGMWGYKPSKYNSAVNTNYLPAPTLNASTLDVTTAANSAANVYTVAIGARTDYTTPAAYYSNTFIVTAVTNPVTYTITYDKNTTDEVTNLPATQNSSTSATEVILSAGVPERAHYSFTGWCSVKPTTSNGIDPCAGMTYLAGATYGIDKTTENVTTLYAMWKIDTFVQTTQVRYENADGTWGAYSTVETETINYGDTYSWSRAADATYKAASVVSYSVTATKTNQVSVYRNTHTLTVTAGTNTSNGKGSGTYRVGQKVTVSVTKATDVTCTSYGTPAWTKSSGATGILSATSGTSVTYTMGTTNDTITAKSTATAVKQKIIVNFDGSGVASATIDGNSITTSGGSVNVTCGSKSIGGTFNSGYEFDKWAKTTGSGTLDSTSTLSTTFNVQGSATLTLTGKSSRIYMQDFTSAQCKSQASSASVVVYDKRDEQSYTVRYINGYCWMTENLALGASSEGSSTVVARALTSSDSNVSSNYTTSILSAMRGNSTGEAQVDCSSTAGYGCYYNYCAATAGTICSSSTTTAASYSICPKGWKLPTHAEQTTLTDGTAETWVTTYVSTFSPVAAGYYNNTSHEQSGTRGYWWSSSALNSKNTRRTLYYNTSYGLYSGDNSNSRSYGYSIRCICSG